MRNYIVIGAGAAMVCFGFIWGVAMLAEGIRMSGLKTSRTHCATLGKRLGIKTRFFVITRVQWRCWGYQNGTWRKF